MDFKLIRSGFDTIEFSVPASYSPGFYACLSDAKERATDSRKPHPTEFGSRHFMVYPSGGQGGYEYLLSTGPFGSMIKARNEKSRDKWSTHVTLSAHGLATKGLLALKKEVDAFFLAVGARFNAENIRIGRADYALDFFAPDLSVDAGHIITHARTTKGEHISRSAVGDRTTYLRVGKMPNKQVCIYDKSKAVLDMKDLIWADIFGQQMKNLGDVYENKGIWRIEFRAGKKGIEKFANPRFFDAVLATAEILYASIVQNIRWATPGNDSNRSRWQTHPIWEACQQHFEQDFFKHSPTPVSDATRAQIVEDYISGLESQSEGLVLTLSAMNGVPAEKVFTYVESHFLKISKRLNSRQDLADQLETRRAKQALLFGT